MPSRHSQSVQTQESTAAKYYVLDSSSQLRQVRLQRISQSRAMNARRARAYNVGLRKAMSIMLSGKVDETTTMIKVKR